MQTFRGTRTVLAIALLGFASAACSDRSPLNPTTKPASQPNPSPNPGTSAPRALPKLIVSNPSSSAAALADSASHSAQGVSNVVYVSLPSGSVPRAISLTIRNLTTNGAATAPILFVDEGFDPVAVTASAGDELELTVTDAMRTASVYRAVVPLRRPPRVVHVTPPHGGIDIPLNVRVGIVFSEPISIGTLSASTVRLVQGTTNVGGSVQLVASSSFAAEFVPDQTLDFGTTYQLQITQGVRDTDGDSLESEVTTEFTTRFNTSLSPILALSAGGWHTCVLRTDGATLCWGGNWWGQLGLGSSVSTDAGCVYEGEAYGCTTAPATVVGVQKFASLASGSEHTCALDEADNAFCWGANHDGTASTSPVQVGGSTKFQLLKAGYYHTCGIRVGGGASCWGHELLSGSLGTGGNIALAPKPVIGGITLKTLTSGAHHVCGLDNTGAAFCWGLNIYAQLGFWGGDACGGPTTSNANFVWYCAKSPVRVSTSLNFVSLSAGWQHTCGLTAAGHAYCWGIIDFADGNTSGGTFGAAPRSVNDNRTFASLSRGELSGHTCGITPANEVWCWGRNMYGQLGDGSQVSTLSPVRVRGGLAFTSITTGEDHTCGVTTTNAVYCWGGNTSGQLGIGRQSDGSLVPVRVVGL